MKNKTDYLSILEASVCLSDDKVEQLDALMKALSGLPFLYAAYAYMETPSGEYAPACYFERGQAGIRKHKDKLTEVNPLTLNDIKQIKLNTRNAGEFFKFRERFQQFPDKPASIYFAPVRKTGGNIMILQTVVQPLPAGKEPEFNNFLEKLSFALEKQFKASEQLRYQQKKLKEFSMLYTVSKVITSTLDLDRVLNLIMDFLVQVVEAEVGLLLLRDRKDGELRPKVTWGLDYSVLQSYITADNKNIIEHFLAGEEDVLNIGDLKSDERFRPLNSSLKEFNLSAVTLGKLKENDQIFGVICVGNKAGGGVFTPDDLSLIQSLIEQIDQAIINARLFGETEKKVTELSNIYNISKFLSTAFQIEDISEYIIKILKEYYSINSVCLMVTNQDTGKLKVERMSQFDEEILNKIMKRMDFGITNWFEESNVISDKDGMNYIIKFMTSRKKEKTLLVTPLWVKEEIVGLLLVMSPVEKQDLIEEYIKLLTIVGSQISSALNNAMTYKKITQRKMIDLSKLIEVAKEVGKKIDTKKILNEMLKLVENVFECDTSALFMIEQEGKILKLKDSHGLNKQLYDTDEIEIAEDPLIQEIIHEGKAMLFSNVEEDTRITWFKSRMPKYVHSLMVVPMIVEGETIGTINLTSSGEKAFSESELKALSLIASQSALFYKTSESLLNLEEFTSDVLRSIPSGIISIDKRGENVIFNEAAKKILGIKDDVSKEEFYKDILADMELKGLSDHIDRVMKTGEPVAGIEIILNNLDTGTLYMNVSISQLKTESSDPAGVVIVIDDITEKKYYEEKMHRADRLAALGELSAGVAHEIKNPLTSIKGFTQLLPRKYADEEFRKKFSVIVNQEVDRLNRIVEELLSFSKSQKKETVLVNLNDLIDRIFILIQHEISKKKISVVKDYSIDIPAIRVDARQIQQVFLNIILNAIQAVDSEGKITVTTSFIDRNLIKQQPKTGEHPADLLGFLKISVADTGYGIPEENLNKVFNPFFTTKNEGTGLGLAISHRIIEEHGGTVDVKSKLGEGSTFTVFIAKYKEKPHD